MNRSDNLTCTDKNFSFFESTKYTLNIRAKYNIINIRY